MTVDDLIALTRRTLTGDDGGSAASPAASSYLISAADMLRFANEAEQEACRRAYLLRDDQTTAICRVSLVAGTARYTLDDRIIRVYGAYLGDDETEMVKYDRHTRRQYGIPRTTTTNGAPWAYTLDQSIAGARSIRIDPPPDAAAVTRNPYVWLDVARLPLQDMTAGTSPEIPDHYHPHLRHWMAYLCLLHPDADIYQPEEAERQANMFASYFGARIPFDVEHDRNERADHAVIPE